VAWQCCAVAAARNLKDCAASLPLPNTYWVISGRVLAGEYPGVANDTESRSRLARLREAGIDSFLDLTEDGELPPYRHLLPTHTEYRRSAIVDTGVPDTVAQTRELLLGLRTALARGRCIYVHCRAGIGRTGLIVGCFLADQESNGKTALKILNRLWLQSARAASWPKVPQTAEQAEYIRRWPKVGKLTS
jgi:hypothetical protein